MQLRHVWSNPTLSTACRSKMRRSIDGVHFCNYLGQRNRGDVTYYSSTTRNCSVDDYVQSISSVHEDEDLLHELRTTTIREWPKAEQLSLEAQGQLLSFLVEMTNAQDVLEIGCFTGYSAICLANGLRSHSHGGITTCDVNSSTMAFAQTYFNRSVRSKQIKGVVKDGMEFLLQAVSDCRQFDLIFIDANKRQYLNYYKCIIQNQLLRSEGLMLFDNTLFRGRVLAHANQEANKKERIARSLAEFNAYVAQDLTTTNIVLPVWDGFTLVRNTTSIKI